MKTTIKSVTITIEELRKLVADSASGNVDAANEFIEAKISEKKERLKQQRMRRAHIKEMKRAREAMKANGKGEYFGRTKGTTSSYNNFNLPLNKELAKCLLWINNRRDALRSNIGRIVKEIAQFGGSASSLSAIESALDLLLYVAREAASDAQDFIHAKYHHRPADVNIPRPPHSMLPLF